MRLLITCFLLFFFVNGWSQSNKLSQVDPIEQQIKTLKPGKAKARAEHTLIQNDLNSDVKHSLSIATMGLNEAMQLKNDSIICHFYDDVGECYLYLNDAKKALFYLNQSFQLAEKMKDKREVALTFCDMASVYQNHSDYITSQSFNFKALTIYEQLKDYRQVAVCNYNIGVTYDDHEDFKKAILYGQKVIQFKPKTITDPILADGYLLIGNAYANLNNNAEAKKYYSQALDLFQKQKNDFGKATILSLLFSTYPGDYQKQIDFGLKAQALWNRMAPDNFYSIYNLGNLGSAYGRMAIGEKLTAKRDDLFKKSTAYLSNAISLGRKNNNKSAIIDFSDSLSVINAATGDFTQAYSNLKTSSSLYKTVYSQANKNTLASMEEKHEIELRDKQILINKLQLENKKRQTWFLFGGIVTLVIIAGLVLNQSRQRKKINIALQQLNLQLDESNKIKIKFFGILNHDLRSPIANFINFLQLKKEAPDLVRHVDSAAYEEKASASAEHLLNTMDDLLLWSKGQMENFKPNIKPVSVESLFYYIQQSMADLSVIFTFSGDWKMVLNTDEHYVRTIMFNLTNNAIKAMKNIPGAAIEWNAWQDDNYKYLSIADNGAGANADAFMTLYDDTASVGIKSGLGLHIVRDLAKAINCRVEVTDNTNTGVRIRLTFL